MKINLEPLESKLQALFESSLHLFPRSDLRHHIADQFIHALQENVYVESDGSLHAPLLFTLCLNTEAFTYWQKDPTLLEFLSNALIEASKEAGIIFDRTPTITLSADSNLTASESRVIVSSPADITQTQAFVPEKSAVSSPATDPRPVNAFVIINGNKLFPLRLPVINIGRRADNHLVIDDPRVSRQHAQLRATRGKYVLFDLNSTGGTFVNGQRISQHSLHPGDVISLAGVAMIYGEDSPSDTTEIKRDRGQHPTLSSTQPLQTPK